MKPTTCAHCEARHYAHGLCNKHYQRLRANGDPLGTRTPTRGMSLRSRFDHHVIVTPGCWLWDGNHNERGYPRVNAHGKNGYKAHRLAYELYVGQIPSGMEIDHLCRNRGCVNPDHLEPVTREENNRRMHRRKAVAA